MTENKRYFIDKDCRTIIDNFDDSYCECANKFEAREYCNKLNTLYEENNELKEDLATRSNQVSFAEHLINSMGCSEMKQEWEDFNND